MVLWPLIATFTPYSLSHPLGLVLLRQNTSGMASAEQPFDDRELRYFLAEILKVSSIAPHDLLNLIQSRGINANWTEIALPNGRSVSACQKAYEHLSTPPRPPIDFYRPPIPYDQPIPAPKPKKKRSLPSEGYHTEKSPMIADRTMQQQQSTFPSVNAPSPSGAFAFQAVPGTSPGEPPRKKRGRPSKEEFDKRVAEAAQRGETYPPPRKRKPPRPSMENIVNDPVSQPGTNEPGAAIEGEGSAGKKKARKPKATPAVSEPPPNVSEGQLVPESTDTSKAFEATASAADHMQIVMGEPTRSTIPETQASGFPARENLLAGMREHAARAEPETTQSSSVLQHESVPRSDSGQDPAASNPATAME